jgi:hypothetical protein
MISNRMITRSDDDEERSLLGKLDFLIHQHYFLVLSVVHDVRLQVIEVEGLSYLVTELSVNWHRLHLNNFICTCRVIVAPD